MRICATPLIVMLGAVSAVRAAPASYVFEEHYFDSADRTELHADVWRPSDGVPRPVLMTITSYGSHSPPAPVGGGSRSLGASEPDPPLFAKRVRAFEHGYVVVSVDVPGTGGSAGCYDFGGPGEQLAVKAAVEWAAAASWSNGRVGVAGGSYDGWTGVMALAMQPRGLVAVMAASPVVSPYDTQYDGAVPTLITPLIGPTHEVTSLRPPMLPDDQRYVRNQLPADRVCEDIVAAQHDPDPNSSFWEPRELAQRAAESDVPVLAYQGALDMNVTPEAMMNLVPGLDVEYLQFLQDEHALPNGVAFARAERFFALHLLGEHSSVLDPRVVVQEAPSLRWRHEESWPPADAAPFVVGLRAGTYIDARGNWSGDVIRIGTNRVADASGSLPTGRGIWSFTPPLDREVHIAGSGTVTMTANGPERARVVVLLYDVSPDGSALMIARGASVLGDGSLEIPLAPQDWRVERGHRLGALITASDDSWYLPHPGTGRTVVVETGTLTVPVLSSARTAFVAGQRGWAFDDIKRPIHIDRATIEEGTVGP